MRTGKSKTAARGADLDSGRIAAAALKLIDRSGLAGFTMRAVADALAVTPMALYHHVKDKAALAALVIEAAQREHPLPPPTGDWREDLWAIARWTRQSRAAHPALRGLRSAHNIWSPAILHITERWVSLWQQSGLPLDAAVRAARMSSMAIGGIVDQELAHREMQAPDAAALAMLPNARLAFKAKHNREAEFETIVRALIDGLHARLKAR
jgi:AcrR family transcriptional regulator